MSERLTFRQAFATICLLTGLWTLLGAVYAGALLGLSYLLGVTFGWLTILGGFTVGGVVTTIAVSIIVLDPKWEASDDDR